MPIGTTLAKLRTMLNAECGEEMDETISPARVSVNNQLLNNQQTFLVNQHGWLRGKTIVNVPAVVGQQYYDLPAGIDFDRLEKPEYTNISNVRYRLGYGIGQDEYNMFRSDLGVKASPVMRWQLVNTTKLQIELWPLPSLPQTIIFTGLLPLTPMAADADTCIIDDYALVLYTAAELLARKGSNDTAAKAAKAKAYFDALLAAFPTQYETFNLGGGRIHIPGFERPNNQRPVVATN
ncbi:MAG: hypothetical protein WCS42_13825 [Verrucomicrobiota bacterium]